MAQTLHPASLRCSFQVFKDFKARNVPIADPAALVDLGCGPGTDVIRHVKMETLQSIHYVDKSGDNLLEAEHRVNHHRANRDSAAKHFSASACFKRGDILRYSDPDDDCYSDLHACEGPIQINCYFVLNQIKPAHYKNLVDYISRCVGACKQYSVSFLYHRPTAKGMASENGFRFEMRSDTANDQGYQQFIMLFNNSDRTMHHSHTNVPMEYVVDEKALEDAFLGIGCCLRDSDVMHYTSRKKYNAVDSALIEATSSKVFVFEPSIKRKKVDIEDLEIKDEYELLTEYVVDLDSIVKFDITAPPVALPSVVPVMNKSEMAERKTVNAIEDFHPPLVAATRRSQEGYEALCAFVDKTPLKDVLMINPYNRQSILLLDFLAIPFPVSENGYTYQLPSQLEAAIHLNQGLHLSICASCGSQGTLHSCHFMAGFDKHCWDCLGFTNDISRVRLPSGTDEIRVVSGLRSLSDAVKRGGPHTGSFKPKDLNAENQSAYQKQLALTLKLVPPVLDQTSLHCVRVSDDFKVIKAADMVGNCFLHSYNGQIVVEIYRGSFQIETDPETSQTSHHLDGSALLISSFVLSRDQLLVLPYQLMAGFTVTVKSTGSAANYAVTFRRDSVRGRFEKPQIIMEDGSVVRAVLHYHDATDEDHTGFDYGDRVRHNHFCRKCNDYFTHVHIVGDETPCLCFYCRPLIVAGKVTTRGDMRIAKREMLDALTFSHDHVGMKKGVKVPHWHRCQPRDESERSARCEGRYFHKHKNKGHSVKENERLYGNCCEPCKFQQRKNDRRKASKA